MTRTHLHDTGQLATGRTNRKPFIVSDRAPIRLSAGIGFLRPGPSEGRSRSRRCGMPTSHTYTDLGQTSTWEIPD